MSEPVNHSTDPWLSIVVYGEPIGKPRMTRRDKWAKRACVMRYYAWCDAARQVAGWNTKQTLLSATTVTVRAYLSIPPSWSQKIKAHASGKPHTSKPDADNIAKAVLDAMIVNDQMVYRIDCVKFWDCGAGPRVEIELS